MPKLIKQIPSYLKLVTDTSTEPRAASDDLASMLDACRAFEAATGWRLEVTAGPAPSGKSNLVWSAPVNPGVGNSPGHIRLFSSGISGKGHASPIPLEAAKRMAAALAKVWSDLLTTRNALAQREAELASGVPVVVRPDDDSPSLGTRLEAVLRAGAAAIGCDAAALYLLDAATTELKLRASWGLPAQRLTEPARPLRGALADLEALLGHAVVTNDERLYSYWKVPEPGFAACVCVPILSQSMPLGTLWAFAAAPRDFSDAQTNIFEVVAGRVAADLERESLVGEALAARNQVRQLCTDDGWSTDELPNHPPYVEGWEVAAKVVHAGPFGGTFYDWFAMDDAGALAVMVGDASERGVGAALTAASARAAGRAIGQEGFSPAAFLAQVNSVLWTTSRCRRCTGLAQATLEPGAANCTLAVAGPVRVVPLSSDADAALPHPSLPLGSDETLAAAEFRHRMSPGEALLIYGAGALQDSDEAALANLDDQLSATLAPRSDAAAGELVDIALEILAARSRPAADHVALVIQRRR